MAGKLKEKVKKVAKQAAEIHRAKSQAEYERNVKIAKGIANAARKAASTTGVGKKLTEKTATTKGKMLAKQTPIAKTKAQKQKLTLDEKRAGGYRIR